MDAINKEDLLFYVTKEDVQFEALEKIGRELNEDELDTIKDSLEWGLDYAGEISIHTVLNELKV